MSLQLAKYMIAGQGGKAPEKYWMAEYFNDTTSSFGSNFEDQSGSMHVSKSGDCYMSGWWGDNNISPSFQKDNNFHLVKIDKNGDLKWHKNMYLHTNGNPNSDSSGYLRHNSRCNGGGYKGNEKGNLLTWLVSLQNVNNNFSQGTFVWDASSDTIGTIRSSGSAVSDQRWNNWRMTHDKDGNMRTIGVQYNSNLSNNQRMAVTINGAGNSSFQFREYNVYPRDIICDSSNNTFVIGYGYFGGTSNITSQGWLIKLASGSSQTIDWYKRLYVSGGYNGVYANTGLRLDANDDLYWGWGGRNSTSHEAHAISKINKSNGNVERWWGYRDNQEYGFPLGRFDVDDDGNVYELNSNLTKIELGSNNGDKPHYLLTKRNSSGTLQWERVIVAQTKGASSTDTDQILEDSSQRGFGRYLDEGNFSIDVHNDSIYLHMPTAVRFTLGSYGNNYFVNVVMKLPLDGSGHSTTPRQLGRTQIIYAQASDIRGSNITYEYNTGTSSSGPDSSYFWDNYDDSWEPQSDTTRGNGNNGTSTSYIGSNYQTTQDFYNSGIGYSFSVAKYDVPD